MYQQAQDRLAELDELLRKYGRRFFEVRRDGRLPDAMSEALDRVDQLQRLARRVAAGEAKTAGTDAEAIDNVREVLLDCEMFYYVAHRLYDVVEKELEVSLGRKIRMVVRIRNEFIEHPDNHGHSRGSQAVGGPQGPRLFVPHFVAECRQAEAEGLLDHGLWVNALELCTTLISRLQAKLAASPLGDPNRKRLPGKRIPRTRRGRLQARQLSSQSPATKHPSG